MIEYPGHSDMFSPFQYYAYSVVRAAGATPPGESPLTGGLRQCAVKSTCRGTIVSGFPFAGPVHGNAGMPRAHVIESACAHVSRNKRLRCS
eukprot:7175924-Pyramimonas_sp.AAC.1